MLKMMACHLSQLTSSPEETPGASGKPPSSEEAPEEQQSVVPPLPPLNKPLPQE